MHAFVQGEFDILVSTTIIENGLDIPRVNTLIVNDAWRFGLAQLYQLRGRVGRADVQAYSYFLYNPVKQLSEEAEKRLDAIMEATELGAGFKIALRDLEIRGAGNLLGSEQHGFVNAVGLNLYTKMLQQTVQSMLGRQPEVDLPPEQALETVVDLPLAAYIPDEYVGGVGAKMKLYQRAAALKGREGDRVFRRRASRPIRPAATGSEESSGAVAAARAGGGRTAFSRWPSRMTYSSFASAMNESSTACAYSRSSAPMCA